MTQKKIWFLVMLVTIVSCNKEEYENPNDQQGLTERLKEIGVEEVDSKISPTELESFSFDSESEAFDFIENLTLKTEDLDSKSTQSVDDSQLTAKDCSQKFYHGTSRGLITWNARYRATVSSSGSVSNVRDIQTSITGATAGFIWTPKRSTSYVTADGTIVTRTFGTLTVGIKVGGIPTGYSMDQAITTRFRPSPCDGIGGTNSYSIRPNAAQIFIERAFY